MHASGSRRKQGLLRQTFVGTTTILCNESGRRTEGSTTAMLYLIVSIKMNKTYRQAVPPTKQKQHNTETNRKRTEKQTDSGGNAITVAGYFARANELNTYSSSKTTKNGHSYQVIWHNKPEETQPTRRPSPSPTPLPPPQKKKKRCTINTVQT